MHSKIRRKRFGYPTFPTVGHKTQRSISGLIQGKKPVVIENTTQLNHVAKNEIVVVSRKLGAKKRIDILKKIEDMKLPMVQARSAKK
jgi:ribosomal protein L32E